VVKQSWPSGGERRRDHGRGFWANWFRAAGFPDLASQPGPVYSSGAQAIQAAKLGHGVALADLFLDSDDLLAGILIRPLDIEVADGSYWLVAPDLRKLSRSAGAFADWIVQEIGKPA
jgi:LysR family glycine cleavage system transcriptional activator